MERAEQNGRDLDWQLLARVAEGDDDAFTTLVERHQARLVRLCERLLHDHDEALDAAQEVFLKTYRKAGSLKPRGQLYTWLYRVATNNCLNRLRRRKVVRFLPLSPPDSAAAERWEPADAAPGPERRLEDRRRWLATRSAIEQLAPNQRAVLVLARFEGLPYKEIAELLGISVGAVEGRLFRALRRLSELAPEEPEAQENGSGGVSNVGGHG